MKSLSSFKRILLYRGVVDFRKWINGLALTVEHELKESLVEDGTLFVFISRNRRKVKCLYWDKSGMAFWTKSHESEKFLFGRSRVGKVELTPEKVEWLLSGIDITKVSRHQEISVKKIS